MLVRRDYVDCRFGQLHVRRAGGGGEKPPLILFHMSPYSGAYYDLFLPEIARDRLVICPDTPGYGGSDAPGAPPRMEEYAAAMVDMLKALDLGEVDLMGFHTGAFVALAVADLTPERVRKLVLPGLPYVAAEDRADRLKMFAGDRPYFTEEGYILKRWTMGLKGRGGQSDDRFLALFAESLRAGVSGMNWGFAAVFRYDSDPVIAALDKPVLIPVPDEMLADNSRAAATLFRNATLDEWPDLKGDLFDCAPGDVADRIRTWLDT